MATPESLAARAYALLHLDPAVLDPVIDGTLLAATDVASPVTVPMAILAAGRRAGLHRRARGAAGGVAPGRARSCGSRARATAIHDERAHRDTYLAHVEAFLAARTPT